MVGKFSATDLQKMKLEKLMQNVDKPIEIPDRGHDRAFPEPPDFIRNIMGSSAGAGSGEFHVYRHLRRKEYARLRFIEEQAKKEDLDAQYRAKLEENKRMADELTAKKRAKRQKKKMKMRNKRRKTSEGSGSGQKKSSESESSDSEPEAEKDSQSREECPSVEQEEASGASSGASKSEFEGESSKAIDEAADSEGGVASGKEMSLPDDGVKSSTST